MSDILDSPSVPPSGGSPDRPVCNAAEIADGKALAVISYSLNFIGIPFFVVPLIMRSDRFSLYHAKQCLVLWLCGVPGLFMLKIVSVIFGVLTCGIGFLIAIPLLILVLLTLEIINLMGLINAVNNRCTPHWLVGNWGEKWFSGIRVETKLGGPS